MPTWSEILTEILAKVKSDPQAIDNVRKDYLRKLADYVKKPVILYATRWMDQPVFDQLDVQINWADKEAFMEVVHGIRERELVLILHSPGGQIEPTQAIVDYLRQKFENITVIVPDAAMSAATLIALAADKILMGSHSNLGPIDPQFILQTLYGFFSISAQSLIEEFERAKKEVKEDSRSLLIWAPKVQQYPPGLLEEAENSIELTKDLGKEWLVKYMLKSVDNADEIARTVVEYLSNHRLLKSHASPVGRDKLKELRLKIEDLEDDQTLYDRVLSVYHATRVTFQLTFAHKIVENYQGRSFIRVRPPPQGFAATQQPRQG
jgi:hypothetical protein